MVKQVEGQQSFPDEVSTEEAAAIAAGYFDDEPAQIGATATDSVKRALPPEVRAQLDAARAKLPSPKPDRLGDVIQHSQRRYYGK